jgi:hypothetical protein
MTARPADLKPIGVLPVPMVARPVNTSVPDFLPYGVIHKEIVIGQRRLGSPYGHVAAARGNGVDQALFAQHAHRAPGRGACDLEFFDQFALGRYPRVRPVLAGADSAPKDLGYLPVRRNWRNRVNAVSAPIRHIDNVSCMRLTSYEFIRR